MSNHDDDLELKALERQLDDAFETTRPRPGFDDELWLRVRSSRPAGRRLGERLAAFWRGAIAVPAVPASAVALLLIVVIGVGLYAVVGLGHGGGGASTGTTQMRAAQPISQQANSDNFGRLPPPAFGGAVSVTPQTPPPLWVSSGPGYSGPVRYTWTGTFTLNITTAPVFLYHEPSTVDADQFAAALGAVLRARPAGALGMYETADYALNVRGTVQTPPLAPAYFISGLTLPPSDAAGGPQAVADVFLAQRGLEPEWTHTVSVDSSTDPTKVVYERQFDVPGYGPAYLVDYNANHYGIEVDVTGNRITMASGMLPRSLDIANYNVVSADDAIRAVLGPPDASRSQTPAVELNHAEIVYVLVPAGDHSFFEPAFLFTGTLQIGGQSYTRRVLVSAVEPSQRTR